MADTPVDNVDTTTTTPASASAEPPASAPDATEGAPQEKPAKKAAAKKAPAKKAPAKKAPAKKAPAKKAAAADAGASESPDDAPKAKKAPAKKAAAKKTATKKAAAAPQEQADVVADDPAAGGAAVLFQAPQVTKTTRKRSQPKPKPADEAGEAAPAPSADDASAGEGAAEDTSGSAADGRSSVQADKKPGSKSGGKSGSKSGGRSGSKSGSKSGAAAGDEATEPAPEAKADQPADAETESDESDEGDETEGDGEGGTSTAARRRRRRGGRRRRKPAGSGGGAGEGEDDDNDDAGDEDSSAEGDSDSAGDAEGAEGGDQGEGGGSASSRRRRRRRREGEAADGDGGDEPNTVTRVRKPRSPEDEITAVAGSTRLEAKKQRRREGREAGRRRAPIVSEAEFLARRESVERVMVVRQRKDVTQIGVLEDKVLVEHYVARESQTSLIGNVYLGRVQNVLPSMEAAFIDIGKGRNAVLYAGEVNWSALGHKEGTPRKIESVLQSGQSVLVQVTKDPIGHKGARLTSQVSLAGRFLVYVPDGTTSGISRKLPDTERGRLKTLLKEIVPETAGVIVRTAAEGASEEELTRDVERLKARWEDVEAKVAKGNAPQLLYGEPDLTLKVVRDLFTEDFAKLVVQGDEAWETVRDYVEHVAPDLSERLEHYETVVDGEHRPDVFSTYRIDEQIAKGLDRKVWLPSGGSLIIDRTEAMTVVDVNTGKFTGSGGNLEETVTKNNLEAAEEIVRQLRLRDIGGIIVVDFIDMVLESNRDLVLRRLVECLGRDRTRHQVAEVTSLGLVQMTRKRIGTGLLEAFSETCDHCQGRGLIVHDLPVEPRRGGGGGGNGNGNGDEGSSRGGRRRRGKGGGAAADEPAAKAVPSPKDVAAMAKPPAEGEADEGATPVDETAEPSVEVASPATESAAPEEETAAPVEESAPPVDETAPAVEESAPPAEEAAPAAQEPAEPAAPKVVTRTRRRAASRPAGPPVTAPTEAPTEAPATTEPEPEPAPEQQPDAVPQDAQDELPLDAAADTGTSADAAEQTDAEASADAPTDEPHVEHVPIKRKGTRKR